MIQIYDVNHVRKYLLENIEDYTIESTLNDKVLSFSVPFSLVEKNMIQEEEYIRTHTDEFVIKEIETNRDKLNIKAVLNLELLEGKSIINFNTSEQTAEDTINLAIAGTTWTCKINGNITKKRTVRKSNTSALEVLNDIKKTFILEFQYDTFNKVINVYEKVGSDKGTYLMEDLNLKSLNIQSDTHDFYTKIIAFGKKATDGTELKTEVTNNTFSNKVKELIWKDDRYTVLSDLQEDAQYKLDQLSKPKVSYKAEVIDLATLNPKYKDILSYGIGDIITLVSKTKAVREKQRIVKITEYPKEPYRNTCEIANTTANFEDIQKEQQDTNETVSNITSDNGTITREAIEHVIQDLVVNEVDANTIQAVNAKIANLEATKATITQLNAEAANIRTLVAGKAEVTNLEAANAKIGIIEADTAQIKTQISHFFSGESGQLIHLTAGNIVVDDGTFTSAMIKDLSASKLTAGNINTTDIDVGSHSGNLLIRDNTLQIKDDSNTVRVQIGKEGSGATADYSLSLWDSKGALIWDARGLTADGIQRAIIRNDMVADNANINAGKLDIGSLFDHINADGSHTLNSSKIHLDNEGQTLDVAFNSLTTKVADIKVGGRNLIRGSKEFKTDEVNYKTGWTNVDKYNFYKDADGYTVATIKNTDNTAHIKSIYTNYILVVPGEKITFSVMVKTPDWSMIDPKIVAIYEEYESDSFGTGRISYIDMYTTADDSNKPTLVNNEWIKYTYTTTVKEARCRAIRVRLILYKNGEIHFKQAKIEKGTIPTDFTEAPEDIEDNINNIQVGGRNLYKNTRDISDSNIWFNYDQWTKDGKVGDFTVISRSFDWGGIRQTFNTKDSKYFTASGYFKGEAGNKFNVFGTTEGLKIYYQSFDQQSEIPNEWKKYYATFEVIKQNTDVSIWFENSTKTKLSLYGLKVEVGNRPTDWTEAPEDLEAYIKAAHDAANVADAKAVAAKTAADNAQTAATNANSLLSDLSSDNKLTPIEKQETKKEVDIIKTEKPQIDANADKYSIDKSNYDTTYDTLISYIDPLLVDLSTTSDIVGNDFRNTFRTYYYYKQELLNQISTKAKTLADDADAKAVAADNKINNLKIGGTNLLRKFSKYREGNKYTVTASHDDNYVFTEGRVTLEADTDYILTFKTNATHTGNNGEDSIELWLTDSGNNKYINMTGNTYKPIEKYYKFNSSTNNGEFIFRYDVNKNGTTYSIWDVKIEKGTKPTDWSPAPEDLEEVTTDIQTKLHVEQGRIDELIKNTTIVKSDGQVVQLKTEYNDTVSTVNTIKSDIASHKTQIDALSGKITGVETKANTLERDLESTKSTLTSTSAKINDLKIGGTNLYLDTKEYSNPNIWTWGQAPLESGKIDGFGYVRIKGNWGRRWQSVTAEPNTIYTMSAWIKRGDQETAPTLIGTYFTDKDNSPNDAVLISKTGYETDVPPELNKWIRISATFRTSSTSTKIFARFEPYVTDFQNKNPDMSFYGLKLEKGNIATDWTPAPQDIETNLNDKVNNIQVGGTNLIRGSKLFILDNDHFKDYTSGRLTMSDDSGFKVATITATGSTSENWAALMSNGYPATHGDSFVFSFDFKTSDLSALDNKNIASFNFYDSTNNRIEQQDIHVPANVTESNKWYRLSFDYTCNNANVVLGSVQGHLAKNGSVSFKRMKVERGNKVTDWTPSPEDFDKDIANAKAAATAADTKASNANDKINNLKVGGRNYYKADSELNAWNDTTVARDQTNARNGFIITYAGNAAGVMRIPKVINSNGQWTVSGYVYSTVADANVEVQIVDVQAWNGHVNNTTWTYFEGTVDVKNYNDTVYNFVDIEGYHITGQVYIVDLKVEKGNKATDWSAAPEDMNKEIQVINTKTSAIEQNLTSITSTVTETTAHVGTLTTKVTANESSIKQLSTSITSKVDAAGVISTVRQTPSAVEYSFNQISPTVQMSSTGLDIKNKVGSSVFNVDANTGNVNMNIYDSHLKLSATGARSAAMWCDVHDLFHIQVPFTQENGGLKIETDTNVTLFEAIKTAANGQEVHLPTYTRIKSLTTEDFSNVGDMTTCHSYLRFFSDGDKKVHMRFNADDSGSGLIIETSRNKPIFEYTHHMDGSDEAIHCHMWLKTSDISTTGTIAITGDLWCSGRATGNAFSALSSSRYKKDIQDIDINVLNSILSDNNIKHYKMIEDEHEDTRTGLILEDLTEDAKALLNLTNNEGIDLYSMTSILWSIVQDQQKQIQDLRNLITK